MCQVLCHGLLATHAWSCAPSLRSRARANAACTKAVAMSHCNHQTITVRQMVFLTDSARQATAAFHTVLPVRPSLLFANNSRQGVLSFYMNLPSHYRSLSNREVPADNYCFSQSDSRLAIAVFPQFSLPQLPFHIHIHSHTHSYHSHTQSHHSNTHSYHSHTHSHGTSCQAIAVLTHDPPGRHCFPLQSIPFGRHCLT